MQLIIKEYINKININDILNFGKINNINLTNDEANILLSYLKKNWEELLYGNPSSIIYEIKNTFDKNKSQKIIDLYNYYKNKYKNYL